MNLPAKVSALLKTLDSFSSVFCSQGWVMINKHLTLHLPQKLSAHHNVNFAEAYSNTLPEELPRLFLIEQHFFRFVWLRPFQQIKHIK
jgi:hypothetical protein